MAHINKIHQAQGVSTGNDEDANLTELYDMIVKAKNRAQGPWYKCSKGRHLKTEFNHTLTLR